MHQIYVTKCATYMQISQVFLTYASFSSKLLCFFIQEYHLQLLIRCSLGRIHLQKNETCRS